MLSKELQNRLYEDFPIMFRGKDESPSHSRMSDGFCCLDGWEPLIRNLCKKLDWLMTHQNNDKGEGALKVLQVKEKWGTLCFYVKNATEIQNDVIHSAEWKSRSTCERCGKDAARLRDQRRWVRTLCSECNIQEDGQQEEDMAKRRQIVEELHKDNSDG